MLSESAAPDPSVDPAPIDALLFLSFGGPERPEDVRPFLENVTAGRGVPPERLDDVAEHYLHLGGKSPINDLNRDIIRRLESVTDLPVYFGNRNWHPLVEEATQRMLNDGVRHALVFATSVWGGYSGCRQYHEDIARALASVPGSETDAAPAAGERALTLTKLRGFHDHPLLVEIFADAVRTAQRSVGDEARLVFTAHSVPTSADARAGGPEDHLYSRQVADLATQIARAIGTEPTDMDVVWQSRSGPPHIPWLEPDILDHLEKLHSDGVDSVVIVPIGFLSDHVEIIWDLDTEAMEKAEELGMACARAATPGEDERFPRLIAELIAEHTEGAPERHCGEVRCSSSTRNGAPCAAGCCEPARRPVHLEQRSTTGQGQS